MVHSSYESPDENTLRIHDTLATILQGPFYLNQMSYYEEFESGIIIMIQVHIAT